MFSFLKNKICIKVFSFSMAFNSAPHSKHKGMRTLYCEPKPELMEINIQQINICLHQLRI